jgi:hypothetical protein
MTTQMMVGGRKNLNTDKKSRRSRFAETRAKSRRADSEERGAYWTGLSPLAQLTALDGRLGAGVGATKQRARIAAAIAALL